MNEQGCGPAAIRRAMEAFEMLRDRNPEEIVRARDALTRHIDSLIAMGECDEERLAVAGLVYLKSLEARDARAKALAARVDN